MTQEQHQNPSQAGMLTEEHPLRRRSRSLSELPGHIQVPILRRQNTSRTQARLEAGAAGVEELRILREKQKQMIDQTMSATQKKKRKQPAQHNRFEYNQHLEPTRQQVHNCCSTISTWHSTSQLTSISEEWDSTSNDAAKKYFPENSKNVFSNLNYQENTKNTFVNKKSLGDFRNTFDNSHYQAQTQSQFLDSLPDKNECIIQNHSLEKNLQNHEEMQNHFLGTNLKSGIQKTDEQTSADKHQTSTHDELLHKNSMSMNIYDDDDNNGKISDQFIQTRSHAVSQSYIHYRDSRNGYNLSNIHHKQNIVKSAHNFPQGRSQSVDAGFASFCGGEGERSEGKLSDQSSIKNDISNSQPSSENSVNRHKSKSRSKYFDQVATAVINSSTFEHKDSINITKCSQTSLSCTATSSFHPLQMFSPQSRSKSKSISWDNLLVVIGLHNESTTTTNETKYLDDENNDDVFKNSSQVSSLNNEYPASAEIENLYFVQRKKMRSQSFTSEHSLYPNVKSGILKTEHSAHSSCKKHENVSYQKPTTEDSEYSKIAKRHSIDHHKQIKEISSTSLLRRASIQCEAVLTQTGTPKRILNPLQDVDINSLQSPGPLHAVTLQYTSVPMRNASDSCVITTNNKCAVLKEKPIPLEIPMIQTSYSVASTHVSHNLHLVSKSDCDCAKEPVSQTVHIKLKNGTSELCNSKLVLQNIHQKHPIPRPRTSILKAFTQEAISDINDITVKEVNNMHNKVPVVLNKTLMPEENASYTETKSNTNQSQSISVSDLTMINSGNSVFIPDYQPTHHTNANKTFCLNSPLENQRMSTKSQNKDLFSNSKKNNDLTCSTQKPDKIEGCTLAESGKSEVKAQKEQEIKRNHILENLSAWVNSYKDRKTNCDLNDGIPVRVTCTKSTNRSINVSSSMPSFHDVDNIAEDKSQMLITKTNGSKSSSCLRHKKSLFHTPDASILSDEGYSTCDSISQQSQLNYGHCAPCDISSPSSDSIANKGFSCDLSYLSTNCGSSVQAKVPSEMEGFKDLKCYTNKKTGAHNCDTEVARTSDNNGTDSYTEVSKLTSNEDYCNSSAALIHDCQYDSKQTQQSTVTTELRNKETSIYKDDFVLVVDNYKNNKDDQSSINVTKLEKKDPNNGEMQFVTRLSNDSVQSSVKTIKYSFKQTAV